jgi:hypothetical protein
MSIPRNIPAQITYETIWDLAVSLAGQTQDNVNEKDSVLLQVYLAGELPDLWNKEAWPELCDNLSNSPVTLTNGVFSKNLGEANEIGDILGIYDQDPRVSGNCWHRLPPDRYVDAFGQVYVKTGLGQVWVDYQLPVPDLLDPGLIGQVNEATLMAIVLPARFRLPLAYRAAAHLIATEDPAMSSQYLKMAEMELARQTASPQLKRPWWRQDVSNNSGV